MTSTIAPLVEKFSGRDTRIKNELKTYAACDPFGFRLEALALVWNGPDDAAGRYVFQLLLNHAGLAEYIANPGQSTIQQAIAATRTALQLGVAIDAALEHILAAVVRDENAGPVIIRIIEVLSALSLGRLVLRLQKELLAHPDVQVCSKAVFELVRAGKGTALVAQTLLQGDPRVQANAVEALWDLSDKEAKSVLMIAAKSPHNCVAANGLMGLYRQGVLDSILQLLRMAVHENPAHRASAIGVIGETKDPRFLPFLTAAFAKTDGKEKLGLVRALSRIRKQLRDAEAGGKIRITLYEARILPDGSRRIVAALLSPGETLSKLSPIQFAIWEDNELITNYSTQCLASPPLLIFGLAVPRFVSKADPFAEAVSRALNACVELKRAADPWCLERYLTDDHSRTAAKEQESFVSKDDHSSLGLHMKKHRGFILDGAFLCELIREPGPRERAASDVAAVVTRLVDTTSRLSGARHLFVFFDPQDIDENVVRRLAMSLRGEPVTVHGFAPPAGEHNTALQALCTARNSGTFHAVPLDQMECAVAETYLNLMDRYEIVYRTNSDKLQAGRCDLRLSTPTATGLLTCSPG